jgi:hypothetical protein
MCLEELHPLLNLFYARICIMDTVSVTTSYLIVISSASCWLIRAQLLNLLTQLNFPPAQQHTINM